MTTPNNQNYCFVLGREQEIAYFELLSVLERFCFTDETHSGVSNHNIRITGNLVFANISSDEKAVSNLINYLAGTIKIYKIVDNIGTNLEKVFINFISSRNNKSKINFGISSYNDIFNSEKINRLGFSIKKKLKGKVSTRFIAPSSGVELSSIVALKNKLTGPGIELGIFPDSVGVLIGLNNPEDWSKRDYDKPCSDKYSGMVPPKLARMMVNIALGQLNLKIMEKCLVVDPFCGSGNILIEAMLLGCDVMGSDSSARAVTDTKTNIEWLKREYRLTDNSCQITVADATKYNFKQLTISDKPLAIITEPFLGEPKKFKPSLNAAQGEYIRVKELYLDFLKNIALLLREKEKQLSNNVICIIFPLVETVEGRRFSLFNESVDEITKLGYTQIRNNFIYGRDYQVVKREIVLLKLT